MVQTLHCYYYCLVKCHQGISDEILILKIALYAKEQMKKEHQSLYCSEFSLFVCFVTAYDAVVATAIAFIPNL